MSSIWILDDTDYLQRLKFPSVVGKFVKMLTTISNLSSGNPANSSWSYRHVVKFLSLYFSKSSHIALYLYSVRGSNNISSVTDGLFIPYTDDEAYKPFMPRFWKITNGKRFVVYALPRLLSNSKLGSLEIQAK